MSTTVKKVQYTGNIPIEVDYAVNDGAGHTISTYYMPVSTKYGASIAMSIDSSTYIITLQLKDQDGNNLGSAQTVDLPLETVVVSGSYDNVNKKIILTLKNGTTVDIPVGDLVSGLQTAITSSNKLSADLVDDSSTTNKFVTAANKTTWNSKQDALTFDSAPTSGSTNPVTSGGIKTYVDNAIASAITTTLSTPV